MSGTGGEAALPKKEANVLKGHEGAVLAARFNGDGNYCLTAGKDSTIRLWNPHRGIHIKTYKSHGREVRDVHVTPWILILVCVLVSSDLPLDRFSGICHLESSYERKVDLSGLRLVLQYEIEHELSHTHGVRYRDNSKLCSCGGDRQLFYWDVATGRVIRKFRGHDSEVNAVKFNEYTSVVVSAGYDRSVRTWDCRSHSTEPIQIIDSFADSVMSVCLTKSEIIAGSVDGTVRTFDIRIGREISDDLGQPVNCISLSNDGNCILASCLDSTLRLLDRSSGELLQEYKGHVCKSYKLDCCLTNTDAHVAGGSEDGYVYFWDLVDASVVSRFRAHASVVNVFVIPFDLRPFVSCFIHFAASMFCELLPVDDLPKRLPIDILHILLFPASLLLGIRIEQTDSALRNKIVLFISKNTIIVQGVYSTSTVSLVVGKFLQKLVTSVSYHPKDDCMLTASVDGSIRVWKA
ncbi:WD repeat domain-containing protein [Drosera capensis]